MCSFKTLQLRLESHSSFSNQTSSEEKGWLLKNINKASNSPTDRSIYYVDAFQHTDSWTELPSCIRSCWSCCFIVLETAFSSHSSLRIYKFVFLLGGSSRVVFFPLCLVCHNLLYNIASASCCSFSFALLDPFRFGWLDLLGLSCS